MEQVIPFYFQNKHNTIVLIVSTMLFVSLFVLIFSPFQSRSWVNNDWQFLAYTLAVALVAGIVLAVSRINLYHYNKKHELHFHFYAVWVIIEIIILTLIYTLTILLVFPKFANEYSLTFFKLFKDIFIGAGFILLIPYTFIFLYLKLNYLNEQLSLLQKSSNRPNPRDERFNFYDDKGELKLSVKPDYIYYIMAADNYVEVYYDSFGKMEKMLLRNSLKNIAINFNNTSLIRCHRSYMVNIKKVSVMKKVRGETVLDMNDSRVPLIPVSMHYAEPLMREITKVE